MAKNRSYLTTRQIETDHSAGRTMEEEAEKNCAQGTPWAQRKSIRQDCCPSAPDLAEVRAIEGGSALAATTTNYADHAEEPTCHEHCR